MYTRYEPLYGCVCPVSSEPNPDTTVVSIRMADHRLVTHVPPHAATHISGPHPSQGTQDVNVPIADALGTSAYTSEHVVNDKWGESLIDKEKYDEEDFVEDEYNI